MEGRLSISRLQACTDALVGYLALFLTTLKALKGFDVPDNVRALEAELVERLSAVLSQGLDTGEEALDVDDIFERWQGVVPLDGSLPPHQVVLMIEEVYCARKVTQPLSGLRVALARLHV